MADKLDVENAKFKEDDVEETTEEKIVNIKDYLAG